MSASPGIPVWDLPTRLFHWSLALSFTGAFLTSESERFSDVHVALGFIATGLVAFRILWGFIGNPYARFTSFVTGPRKVMTYLESLTTDTPQHHVGHNPAGAWAILAMLTLTGVACLSGVFTWLDIGGEAFEELHEAFGNGMLLLVIVHVAGVIFSSWLHGENLVAAMITGRKAETKTGAG